MEKLHNVSIFWSNLIHIGLFDSAIWESSFVNGLEKDRHFQNDCVVNWLRTVWARDGRYGLKNVTP